MLENPSIVHEEVCWGVGKVFDSETYLICYFGI